MATRKEEIAAYLQAQGLKPKVEDFGVYFQYKMRNFWFLTDDEDEQYLRLVMPGIMDVDKNNLDDVLKACNKVTKDVKIAKCFVSENSDVWIACEQLLDQDPKLEDVIPRSLRIMIGAYNAFLDEIDS